MARPKSYSQQEQWFIAFNMKAAREKKFSSAGECAKAFHMALPQWSNYEKCRHCPSPVKLHAIAKHLGTTKEALLKEPKNWDEVGPAFIASLESKKEKAEKKRKGSKEDKPSVTTTTAQEGAEILSNCIGRMLDLSRLHRDGTISDDQIKDIAQRLNDFILLQEKVTNLPSRNSYQ